MKAAPLRMCIACRQMKGKDELIRIVKSGDNIVIDSSFKAAGRGAYVCNKGECLKKMIKYKLLNKAFKCEVKSEIYSELEGHLNNE